MPYIIMPIRIRKGGNIDMSFKNLYIKTYWKYFRSLEKRLARTEDYVAFDSVNAKAYSIE